MKQLLNKLFCEYPFTLNNKVLSTLINERYKILLIKNKILINDSPTTSADCESCGLTHDIYYETPEKPFYICTTEGSSKQYIPLTNLIMWRFEIEALCNDIAKSLAFKAEVINIINNEIWQIGVYTLKGIKFQILYCRSDLQKYFDSKNEITTTDYSIVIYSEKGNSDSSIAKDVITIPLINIMNDPIKNDNLWNKEILNKNILKQIKFVDFHDNGDLFVKGRIISSVSSGTPQYYFLLCLWLGFDKDIRYETIYIYCKKEITKRGNIKNWTSYEHEEQKFCNQMKSIIKKNIEREKDKATFEKIIKTSKNAYRITNPI